MSHSVVFVGGPKDGERMNVSELRPRLAFPVIEKAPVRLPEEWDKIEPAILFKNVFYNLERFRGEKEFHAYYQLDGMTGDQAIESLLANYRPEKAKGK